MTKPILCSGKTGAAVTVLGDETAPSACDIGEGTLLD